MLRKTGFLFLLFTSMILSLYAQEKPVALVRGRLINEATKEPASEVQVTIPALQLLAYTDGEGNFSFSSVPQDSYALVIGGTHYKSDTIRIVIDKDVTDLGSLSARPADAGTSQQSLQIPTIALEDNDLSGDDDGVKTATVSGLLSSGRDPFLNTAAYVFGPYRFQPRGYERNQQQVLINGAPMNDIETGDAFWSQWGGLNDVFRSRNNTYGLQPSDYTFGAVNGSVYFDAAAASQNKQTRITYSLSNRQYRNRLMFTRSSGALKNGWAYSVSLGRRWAKEGYVEGTFYDGYSYYAAISKKTGDRHQFHLTTFGAPTSRGKMAPITREAAELAGSNFYNPNWGYQNGEKRNAKVFSSFQPVTILNYEFTPDARTKWNTAIAYQFGKTGNTTLDWYNAQDPRPDYYRYLPSYYLYNTNVPDHYNAEKNRQRFLAHRQIDWDALYNVNYMNRQPLPDASGAPTGETLRRSLYVLGNDIDDVKKYIFNTNLQRALNDHISIFGGLTFLAQHTESYRRLEDLLGGDYYLNINQFAEQNYSASVIFNQNDINNPYSVIKEGDKYYYHYINRFRKGWAWAQAEFSYNRVDFFIAGNYGFNAFSREGLFKNGLFPDHSYGKGATQLFSIYGLKGGVTYKINGRNYLFINGGTMADAPTVDNTYISPRTRDFVVDNPVEQKTYTAEGGYLLRSPNISGRLVGYVTDVKDVTEIKRFYNEGQGANTFTNYVLQGLDMRFIGTEIAVDYKLNAALNVMGVAAIGQAFYTSNPEVKAYYDNQIDPVNGGNIIREKDVYIRNFYVASGPQSAYSLGLNYRSPKYWYANINFNYFDRNYVDIAADRRSVEAIDITPPGSDLYNAIVNQEKLPAAFSVDLFGGKSFLLSKLSRKIPQNTYLYLNVGVSNLLDNRNIATGGFESLRFDYGGSNVQAFPSKYFYAYGRNFFVNLSLKF